VLEIDRERERDISTTLDREMRLHCVAHFRLL
jgi:hypothetical protein